MPGTGAAQRLVQATRGHSDTLTRSRVFLLARHGCPCAAWAFKNKKYDAVVGEHFAPVLPVVVAVVGTEAPSLVAGAVVVPTVGLAPKIEEPPNRPVDGAAGAAVLLVAVDVGVEAAAVVP